MYGQRNGGNVIIRPLNKRLLLEKVELEETETSLGFFNPTQTSKTMGEFFKVLDKAADCAIVVETGDLISAETITAVGKLEGVTYYVCHENSVVAVIKGVKDD